MELKRSVFLLLFGGFIPLSTPCMAQVVIDKEDVKFNTHGYLRTGVGASEGGETQAHFQMPGALNKFSLGNQADTYGELEFDYTHYLDSERSRSIDGVWMLSMYEEFGSVDQMSLNMTEQLYLRFNNLFNRGESLWIGKRFYDRYAIHMLDRQWINPGHGGLGLGAEHLLDREGKEDIKVGVFGFKDEGVISYLNELEGNLYNYTADVRWVHHPLSKQWWLNLALNYTYRPDNHALGYRAASGFGAFAWVDYEQEHLTNTTALLLRQGANIPRNHWTGMSERENPFNTNLVTNNLHNAYSIELNNNFLYDDLERFAINIIALGVVRNYGTAAYLYGGEQGASNLFVDNMTPAQATPLAAPKSVEGYETGKMLYWTAVGVRPIYYLSDQFRLTFELTHEYVNNTQLGVAGQLGKLTFSPEFSLGKGFYSRPVLRPLVTYAMWSDSLQGYIGTTPEGAPFANKSSGFTFGLQFEIWW